MARHTDSEARRRANRNHGKARAHPRVRARPVQPGARIKVTRRCLERRLFLVPSPELNELIGYWLAVCIEAHGIELHAACFMSNHYHLDITDPAGNLPAFKNHFNAVLARAVNSHRGRFDRFWSADQPCDVRILDDDDLIDRMSYTLANPVAAGLVRRGHRWPGLTTASMRFGDTRVYRRPKAFFDPNNGNLPETATLTVVRPRCYHDLSDDDFQALLRTKVREREEKAIRDLRAEHRRIAGERRVLRQRWRDRPQSREHRFGLTPTFAASSRWSRIAQAQRDRAWENAYAIARARWLDGQRDVLFPRGTYWLRRFAGALVRSPATGPP